LQGAILTVSYNVPLSQHTDKTLL